MEQEDWSEELEECKMYKERTECEKEIAELEKMAKKRKRDGKMR